MASLAASGAGRHLIFRPNTLCVYFCLRCLSSWKCFSSSGMCCQRKTAKLSPYKYFFRAAWESVCGWFLSVNVAGVFWDGRCPLVWMAWVQLTPQSCGPLIISVAFPVPHEGRFSSLPPSLLTSTIRIRFQWALPHFWENYWFVPSSMLPEISCKWSFSAHFKENPFFLFDPLILILPSEHVKVTQSLNF